MGIFKSHRRNTLELHFLPSHPSTLVLGIHPEILLSVQMNNGLVPRLRQHQEPLDSSSHLDMVSILLPVLLYMRFSDFLSSVQKGTHTGLRDLAS